MTTNHTLELIDQAKPWRSIATHFSPRYLKVPEIIPEHTKKKTLVAFDFMRVSWSQLEWAWRYTEIYASLLQNDEKVYESFKEDRYIE